MCSLGLGLRSVKFAVYGNAKVPQSNFPSTAIFNFDHVYFLAYFAIFLELVCRTESVRQRNHWLATKMVYFDPFCGQPMIPLLH